MDKHGEIGLSYILQWYSKVTRLYRGRTKGEYLIARPLGVAVHVDEDVDAVLRWKSQRIKIYRLAHR